MMVPCSCVGVAICQCIAIVCLHCALCAIASCLPIVSVCLQNDTKDSVLVCALCADGNGRRLPSIHVSLAEVNFRLRKGLVTIRSHLTRWSGVT